MSAHDAALNDHARALHERQLALLGELADAAMELTLAIKQQAIASGDPAACAKPFACASRAVRQTLMLQERVLKSLQGHDTAVRRRRNDRRKAEVQHLIERTAERQERENAEHLAYEALERLEREEDLHHDLTDKPLSEVIADLCQQIGIEPDWALLEEIAGSSPLSAPAEPAATTNADALISAVRSWWMRTPAPEASDDDPPDSS